MQSTTITDFRSNIKKYLDSVADNHDELIINRSDGRNVVVISLEEYNSWKETEHLLSSKANAERLRNSIKELNKKKGTKRRLID